MASTAAYSYRSAQEVYEYIDTAFQLSNEQLVELTKAFRQEFEQGLEKYNQAMVMTYAICYFFESVSHKNLDPPSLLVFLTAQRKGKWFLPHDLQS